jgi:hypothetical protein
MSAGTPGAATQVPNDRRSAARVLMDEGWAEFTAGWRPGDKVVRFVAITDVTAERKWEKMLVQVTLEFDLGIEFEGDV